MKNILAFLFFIASFVAVAQVEDQLSVLTRTTAMPAMTPSSISVFQELIRTEQVDYIMVFNLDTVNVFYYESGEINILKPGTFDVLVSVRDQAGKVVDYPYLFFDRSSYGRRLSFTVGLCKECRNSGIGVQFGFLDK